MPDLPNAHDPALDRCGNCGEKTWENHDEVKCGECGQWFRLCSRMAWEHPIGLCGCHEHDENVQFRTETDADRQAAWAGARRL